MIKLTAILMLLGCLQLSARSYGQISISKKNATLQELFLDIYKQSGYYFYCNDNLLSHAKKVDIDVKNASLPEVLEICFRNQPLTFTITDRVIVVKAKAENPAPKPEADIDIHGRVVDENGDPVPGVTVSVKGTKSGVSTDANGEFNLGTSDKNTVLIFTSINMETFEMELHGQTILTVNLKTKISALQNMVVNKGYYNTTERLNTGSVSKVAGADIEKQPISNPLEAIEGRMPGVYVQQVSGVSGSGFNLQIRGQNSLRTPANNSVDGNLPLYIIDGMPFTSTSPDLNTGISGLITPSASPLNAINPSDIESIEILKDADATAIYGSRGSNGVVLITTKKGKTGKTKIDINAYNGSGAIARKMKLLHTNQYLEMRHEAFNNDAASPMTYDHDVNGDWDTTRYTDWQQSIIGGTAHLTSMQASVSGGNQNTQFLFGGGFYRQGTVFPGDFADQKSSAHLNLNHISENKKFVSLLFVNYLIDHNNLPLNDPTHTALMLPPNAPSVYQPDGTLNWANGSWPAGSNPFSLFLQSYSGNTNNLIANANIRYELLPGLTLKINAGYNNIATSQVNLTAIRSQDPAYHPTASGNYGNSSINSWIVEPQAEYLKNISRGKLSILLGGTVQQDVKQYQSFFARGYTSDALIENLTAAPSFYAASSDYSQYKYAAGFGRLNYNWEDKYLINFTGRRDGSSRFGPKKQFANFGAIGVGWVFSKEKVMQSSLPFLSYGKIRGSYGLTGSDQIGDYNYLSTYSSTQYPYNGTSGLTLTRLVNPNYSWEKNKKLELALEVGFIEDRVILTTDYYHNNSANQLVSYPLPAITGQTSIQANLPATVVTNGLEFQLNIINIKSKYFSWTTSANLTIPHNKLISFPNLAGSSFANVYVVGKSLFVKNLFHYTGINTTTGLYQFDSKSGSPTNPTYPEDLETLKEISQSFFGGLQNSFKIRGWQLDIFFQFVKQTGLNYLFNFQPAGTSSNQPFVVLSRWQKPGDQSDVQLFTQQYGGEAFTASRNISNSDAYIGDASFIRLKNISLSYQIPDHWTSKIKSQNIRVYLHGQNLITISKYLGLDPETQNFFAVPPLKALIIGIQITL